MGPIFKCDVFEVAKLVASEFLPQLKNQFMRALMMDLVRTNDLHS